GFAIADYDTTRPLIIDPVLSYSTYLGGGNDDYPFFHAPDGNGGVWVAGGTVSTDCPTAGGGSGEPGRTNHATLVRHCNCAGPLICSTYLGGGKYDNAYELVPDGSGGVWVTGFTESTNFPTAGGGSGDPGDDNDDVFVSHLSAAGTLTFSTYLGGD